MKRARWRDRVGLPALLLIALMSTAVTPAAMTAGLRPAAISGVDCRAVTPAAVARDALDPPRGRGGSARVLAQLAKRGELTGRVLSAQTAAGAALSIALPVESFVGPTQGDLVVYTRNAPATGSEVRALSLVSGCDTKLASPSEIVRSAVLDPKASAAYVHSVTRIGRADAGVTRYDLATGVAIQALPPLRPADDFGPIFGTDLEWSTGGDALAVQSCGFSSCLTRVLNVATGSLSTFDEPGQGAFIGLTADHLVTFADCLGLPCAVLSADVRTGAVSVLAAEASSATVVPAADGHAVVSIQTPAGNLEVLQ